MKTCSTRSKRRDQYLCDNRETNDQRNPFYALSTMNNIFHDIDDKILVDDYLASYNTWSRESSNSISSSIPVGFQATVCSNNNK